MRVTMRLEAAADDVRGSGVLFARPGRSSIRGKLRARLRGDVRRRPPQHASSDVPAMNTESFSNERGIAVVIALLTMVLLGALAAALVTLTTTETLVSASFRRSLEVAHGAEAALERGLHDLSAMPDWSPALAAPPANVTSSFDDGETTPRGPDGRMLDLARAHGGIASARATRAAARRSSAPIVPSGACSRTRPSARCSPSLVRIFRSTWRSGSLTTSPTGMAIRRLIPMARSSCGRWPSVPAALAAAVEARIERAVGGELRLLAWRQAR